MKQFQVLYTPLQGDGGLPELRMIRELLKEHYGQEFVKAALELCPGNLVNQQVVNYIICYQCSWVITKKGFLSVKKLFVKSQVEEKLSKQLASDDMKHMMVKKIAKDYCLEPEILRLEYYSKWHEQVTSCLYQYDTTIFFFPN